MLSRAKIPFNPSKTNRANYKPHTHIHSEPSGVSIMTGKASMRSRSFMVKVSYDDSVDFLSRRFDSTGHLNIEDIFFRDFEDVRNVKS